MRIVTLAGVAALLACAAGCGSNDGEDASPSEVSRESPMSASASAAPSSRPGQFTKAIGEQGKFQCSGPDLADCDVRFAVTDAHVQPDCNGQPAPAGREYVRFDAVIDTAPQWRASTSASAMRLSNWGIVTPAGSVDQADTRLRDCGADPHALDADLPSGAHIPVSAVVEVDPGARYVRYTLDGVWWQWPVTR